MDITDKQLDSFNKKDLTSFMTCYSPHIKVFMLQSGQILADGKDQLENIMRDSFTKETISTTRVVSKIKQGNLIINQEEIKGHGKDKIIRTISIYEIENDLISKLWFGGRSTQ